MANTLIKENYMVKPAIVAPDCLPENLSTEYFAIKCADMDVKMTRLATKHAVLRAAMNYGEEVEDMMGIMDTLDYDLRTL